MRQGIMRQGYYETHALYHQLIECNKVSGAQEAYALRYATRTNKQKNILFVLTCPEPRHLRRVLC